MMYAYKIDAERQSEGWFDLYLTREEHRAGTFFVNYTKLIGHASHLRQHKPLDDMDHPTGPKRWEAFALNGNRMDFPCAETLNQLTSLMETEWKEVL